MIGIELDKGKSLFEAIGDATTILEGAYSFVLISILEPDNMYIFKNTGTMVIGVSKSLQFKESDSPDLLTKQNSPMKKKDDDHDF